MLKLDLELLIMVLNEHCPRNMLMTGGVSFISCYFLRYMLNMALNVNIFNLYVLAYGGSLVNNEGFLDECRHILEQGVICDQELIDRLLREYVIYTVVYYAAASYADDSISASDNSTLAPQYDFCFHHISDDEVYGSLEPDDPPFSETISCASDLPSSGSKAGSDHLPRAYFCTYELLFATTSSSNNYELCQYAEKLPLAIIRNCKKQLFIPVYGDGSNTQYWLYIEDHCSATDAVVRRGRLGKVHNIIGVNEWANTYILRHIYGLLEKQYYFKMPPNKMANTGNESVLGYSLYLNSFSNLVTFSEDFARREWHYAIDAEIMLNDLDWHPAETFETGIRKTIETGIRKTIEWYMHEG